jgi:hypothetical protein
MNLSKFASADISTTKNIQALLNMLGVIFPFAHPAQQKSRTYHSYHQEGPFPTTFNNFPNPQSTASGLTRAALVRVHGLMIV